MSTEIEELFKEINEKLDKLQGLVEHKGECPLIHEGVHEFIGSGLFCDNEFYTTTPHEWAELIFTPKMHAYELRPLEDWTPWAQELVGTVFFTVDTPSLVLEHDTGSWSIDEEYLRELKTWEKEELLSDGPRDSKGVLYLPGQQLNEDCIVACGAGVSVEEIAALDFEFSKVIINKWGKIKVVGEKCEEGFYIIAEDHDITPWDGATDYDPDHGNWEPEFNCADCEWRKKTSQMFCRTDFCLAKLNPTWYLVDPANTVNRGTLSHKSLMSERATVTIGTIATSIVRDRTLIMMCTATGWKRLDVVP